MNGTLTKSSIVMDNVGQGLAPAEKEERIPFVPYDNTGNDLK